MERKREIDECSSLTLMSSVSLLAKRARVHGLNPTEKLLLEEREIIETLKDSTRTLKPVLELAKGIEYTQPLFTGWKPPLRLRRRSSTSSAVLNRYGIQVSGGDGIIPPPMTKFEDMRLPEPILEVLKLKKGITRPTPIQMQALPVALSGRDLIGISSTGSGKTLAFVLPLILAALQEELTLPILPNEGPFGLVLCPSRELAKQIHQVVEEFLIPMSRRDYCYPELRSLLCVGGTDMRSQFNAIKKGVHIVVATPGRLKHMLALKAMKLHNCRFLTLDEADRLIDLGFEDDIREILDGFKSQRQTVLFSATMPEKIQNLANSSLVMPVTVKVGGSVNLDVVQEVEYVKSEDKMVYLLESLQKTQPPVLIFCTNKNDVDGVHEYLLLKGVDAVAIHGGKDQEDRDSSIASFKSGKMDVLVATDVVSKGLDFPDIQHVINFDMPADIENYVHRIGRTGRCGKTGVATTFINKDQSKTTLLDLKHQLKLSKQRIPPVLSELDDDPVDAAITTSVAGAVKGCAYCGGLGHRVTDCPKLEHHQKSKMIGFRDNWNDSWGSY